jgi:uncharacterized tellurite resistance protein B-like protein
MIDLAKRFFGRITDQNTDHNREAKTHDVRIAACALFLEMAGIDGEFSESEKERILGILKKEYELPEDLAIDLMEASKEELKGSVDLWRFASLINSNYSMEEKMQVIETVWRIAFTDGKLDKYEDYLVHKLAQLLRLSHRQLIDAKLKAKGAVRSNG